MQLYGLLLATWAAGALAAPAALTSGGKLYLRQNQNTGIVQAGDPGYYQYLQDCDSCWSGCQSQGNDASLLTGVRHHHHPSCLGA